MPIDRNDDEERIARLDWLLEETRTKSEALRNEAERVKERARAAKRQAAATIERVRDGGRKKA